MTSSTDRQAGRRDDRTLPRTGKGHTPVTSPSRLPLPGARLPLPRALLAEPGRRIVGTAVAVVSGLLGLFLVARILGSAPIDLDVYRGGGAAVLAGHPVYAGPVSRGLLFTYPPFAALLFTPLAVLPAAVYKGAFLILNCALLVLVAWRSWRLVSGWRGGLLAVAALATAATVMITEAVRSDLAVGQINLVLLALIVLDLTGREDRPWRGVGVGIAAGIKLTPLIFVLYLLAVRRFRAAAVAAGTFVGTILLGFAVPGGSSVYWLGGRFANTGTIYFDMASRHNQSIRGLLLRNGLPDAVWMVAAAVVAVATLVVAARAARRGRPLLAVTLCGMCAAAVSPWSWGHHWVWVLPLAVLAAERVIVSAGRTPWWAILLLLPFTLPRVRELADPLDGHGAPVFPSGPIALFLGNTYLWLFVTALVLGFLETVRKPPVAAEVIGCRRAA